MRAAPRPSYMSITPELASLSIATTYRPRLLEGEKISVHLFSLLSRAITLEDHQHIVEFLLHLSKSPDVIVDARPFKENGRIYWRDIPGFSFWFFEEALRKSSTSFISYKGSQTPHRWSRHSRHRPRKLPIDLARTSTTIQSRQQLCCTLPYRSHALYHSRMEKHAMYRKRHSYASSRGGSCYLRSDPQSRHLYPRSSSMDTPLCASDLGVLQEGRLV